METKELKATSNLREALNTWLRLSPGIQLADEVDKWLADRLRTRISDLCYALEHPPQPEGEK